MSPLERKVGPLIAALRLHASEVARAEVERTMRRLGADPEVEERLAAMASALVSGLLDAPSTRLREAAADDRSGERLLAAAAEMFGVPVD